MPKAKPKRAPVRRTSKKPTKAKSRTKGTKIRKDPVKEYQEVIKKAARGAVEVLNLADDDCLANVKLHISTQSLELDRLLNGQGVPCGRTTEIYGPPHIGKSTLLDHLFAQVQRMGGQAVLADTEGARDIRYTQAIGVDPSKLHYLQFKRGEMHVENVLMSFYRTIDYWATNYPDVPVVIGWDALGGTATRDEVAKELAITTDKKTGEEKKAESRIAGAAKILHEACRLIPDRLGNTKIALVICNHEYQKIDTRGFGTKTETYGGSAVRLLSSIRLQLYPSSLVKRSDGVVLGREIGVKLAKNRLGNPYAEARVALLSGIGIDNIWSIYTKFASAGLIIISGGWSALNLDGEIIKFQGWNGLAGKCQEDETLFPRLVSVYGSLP